MKKCLWLGSYQSYESFSKMPIKNMGQASARTSQEGLIRGLDAVLDKEYVIDTIGYIPYAPYPSYPYRSVRREEWNRNNSSTDISVEYVNVKYFNYYFREKSLYKEVKKWFNKQASTTVSTVFVYAPSVGKLRAALWVKKMTGCKIILIIPDIPENITVGADKVVLTAKKVIRNCMNTLMKKCDGWVLYSEYMAEYYNLTPNQWVLVEGVLSKSDVEFMDSISKKHKDKMIYFYCGSLDYCRGIKEILEAFKSINSESIELWFAGTGQCDNLIQDALKTDTRIKHLGFIQDRTKMLELIKEADVLLHTRYTNIDSLSKYSFPSKIFEYMASGNVVLSVRMDSIPKEYDNYLVYIDTLSVEALNKQMVYLMTLTRDKMKTLGARNRDFIVNNKNSVSQANKIIGLINKL